MADVPTPLPAQGSTSWYQHYADLDAGVRAALTTSTTIDARDYGVDGAGVSDFTTELAQAAAEATTAGGGTITLPVGVIYAENIPVVTDTAWQGHGRHATILRLPDASTGHNFKSDDFDTLTGTDVRGGPSGWSIRRLSIDGNRANAPSGGHGIATYGYEYVIEDVDVRNAARSGLFLDYFDVTKPEGATSYLTRSMESHLNRVTAHHNGEHGFHTYGSHDSMAVGCIAYENGRKDTGVWAGFAAEGNGWNWLNCHSWGWQQYAWWLRGHNLLTNCQAEGARDAGIFIEWHRTWIHGGAVFFPGTATAVGVRIGDATHAPEEITINGLRAYMFGAGSGAALDLTYAGPGLNVRAAIHQPDGVAVAGTPPVDARVDIHVSGGVDQGSIFRVPGYTFTPDAALVFTTALTDDFTGADGATLDAAKWTVTEGAAAATEVVINGNRARLTTGATGGYSTADRVNVAADLAPVADVDILARHVFETVGVESYFFYAARATDADPQVGSNYAVMLGGGFMEIIQRVNGTPTNLENGSYTELGLATPAVGDVKHVRLNVAGDTLTVKVWDDGDPEPTTPTYTGAATAVPGPGLVTIGHAGGGTATSGVGYVDSITVATA